MKPYYFLFLIILFIPQDLFSQIGVNTEQPNPQSIDQAYLDINGRVILRNIQQYDTNEPLIKTIGVDKNGVLVKIGNVPTDAAFYQSPNTDSYTTEQVQAFNSGTETLVGWNPSTDLIFDDLLEFDATDNSFAFTEDGQYEVGGFINFGILMPSTYTTTLASYVGINATIQYMRKNDEASGWKDLSTCRKVFTGGALSNTAYRTLTMNIPLVLYSFSVGDKLRMIVKKPIGNSVDSFQITNPAGSIYSKSLKVTIP